MKLENQVINLEIAKKLKGLGVKQESCFYFCTIMASAEVDLRPAKEVFGQEIDLGHDYGEEISAFTVAELGEMLPFLIEDNGSKLAWECYKTGDGLGWESWLEKSDGYGKTWQVRKRFEAKTEADARGLMLIYLLENSLITLK